MGHLGDDTWADLLAPLAGISRMSQADTFERADMAEMPLHTLAEYTAPVSHRLLRHALPAGRTSSSRRIVVTLSQELAPTVGAGFNGPASTWMARLVRCMPSAFGRLQCSQHG